jgi:excisionase family DNA binding protein
MTSRLLTLHEVAERLHLSYGTVRRLVATGKLPGSNVGRWRVAESDLNDFLARTRTSAADERIEMRVDLPAILAPRFS